MTNGGDFFQQRTWQLRSQRRFRQVHRIFTKSYLRYPDRNRIDRTSNRTSNRTSRKPPKTHGR